MENCGIYLIKCSPPGKLPYYYVGQSKNLKARRAEHFSDLKRGCHSNARIRACWSKYGENSFSFDVLLCCAEAELDAIEQWFINEMHGHRRVLNLAKDVAAPNRGRVVPDDVRRKISLATKGRVVPPERRAAISKALTGRKMPPSVSEALSRRFKGRTFTGEHREKLAASHRLPVIGHNIATGEAVAFPSIKDARKAGFSSAGVCRCCQGQQKVHRGHTFRYASSEPAA